MAYRPDPQAHAIDAFSFSWTGLTFYVFLPLSLYGHILKKKNSARWLLRGDLGTLLGDAGAVASADEPVTAEPVPL